MPKGVPQHKRDQRIEALQKMKGSDFAMSVAPDFICLVKDERTRAVKVLAALDETINKQEAMA